MTTQRILRYASDLHLELLANINDPKLLSFWDFKRGENDE